MRVVCAKTEIGLLCLLLVLTSESTLARQSESALRAFWPRDDTADSGYVTADDTEIVNQGDLAKLGTFTTKPDGDYIDENTPLGNTKHIGLESWKLSAYHGLFNDPLWDLQWYEQDYRTKNGPVVDHNVVPVYKQGITGRGVIVGVVDSGVQGDHPDLAANYVDSLSFHPFSNSSKSPVNNPHGTWSAGVIAMAANNSLCGVGIAFNAKITAMTFMNNGKAADLAVSQALSHRLDKIDVYSNSWSLSYKGKELGGLPRLMKEAIAKGVTEGRSGKGAIYVVSAGNDASYPLADNCASDGFVNSPFVVAIASAHQRGGVTPYSERCPAVFATAYSNGYAEHEGVVTTTVGNECTTYFGGNSAAVPIASGIVALLLEANSNLTYRDVMHLIVMGSEVAPLADNLPNWITNGAGFLVSNVFGFGLLNAENMVDLARGWKRVPEKRVCVVRVKINKTIEFDREGTQEFDFETDACQDQEYGGVVYLEHVELATTIVTLIKVKRGDMSIRLTSPEQTKAVMMEPRVMDGDQNGFSDWSITSKNTWGENPKGTWKIQLTLYDFDEESPFLTSTMKKTADNAKFGRAMRDVEKEEEGLKSAFVRGFTLTLHGTTNKPEHYAKEKPYRQYAEFLTLNANKYI